MTPLERARFRARRTVRKRRAKKRGVALIMVLGAITVLTVFLTELVEETTADLSAALAERDALQAEYYARSAVNLSRLLIASEPTARIALPIPGVKQLPIWAHSDMVLGPFNGEEGQKGFADATGMDMESGENLGFTSKGHFELRIIDEESKINANMAAFAQRTEFSRQMLGLMQPVQYNPLFEQLDPDGQQSDRRSICSAIVDWVDDDENLEACDPFSSTPSAGGREDNIYQVINQDYQRKNAPFDSLEELRMIRGIGDDYWSTFIDSDPANPDARNLTVWGREQININTANAQTLWGFACAHAQEGTPLCVDPSQAQRFIMSVEMLRSIVQGVPAFTNPKQFISLMKTGTMKNSMLSAMLGNVFEMMGLQPVVFRTPDSEMEKALTVKSRRFSIYAIGVVPRLKREVRVKIHAVVAFDSAQPLGQNGLGNLLGGNGQVGQGNQNALNPNGQQGGPNGQVDPNQAAALGVDLMTNPAGLVLYWRVE